MVAGLSFSTVLDLLFPRASNDVACPDGNTRSGSRLLACGGVSSGTTQNYRHPLAAPAWVLTGVTAQPPLALRNSRGCGRLASRKVACAPTVVATGAGWVSWLTFWDRGAPVAPRWLGRNWCHLRHVPPRRTHPLVPSVPSPDDDMSAWIDIPYPIPLSPHTARVACFVSALPAARRCVPSL